PLFRRDSAILKGLREGVVGRRLDAGLRLGKHERGGRFAAPTWEQNLHAARRVEGLRLGAAHRGRRQNLVPLDDPGQPQRAASALRTLLPVRPILADSDYLCAGRTAELPDRWRLLSIGGRDVLDAGQRARGLA